MDGRQLLHRLQDEDAWLGEKGISKREKLASKIEEKETLKEQAIRLALEEKVRMENQNMDKSRIGIFDPDVKTVERNKKLQQELHKVEDEKELDPRINIFQRATKENTDSSSWFNWFSFKSRKQKQVEAEQEESKKVNT